MSSVQLGLIGSVFIAVNGLLVPLAGILGDAHSRKRIVSFSLLTWSVATLCTGFGNDMASLILARGVGTAAGEAFYFPSAVAMLLGGARREDAGAGALIVSNIGSYAGLVAERVDRWSDGGRVGDGGPFSGFSVRPV